MIARQAIGFVRAQLAGFAGYGFCKSHAASFALIAYQTLWLKRYHAPAFYCALLNQQPMGFYPPEVIVGDARRHGVDTLPPSGVKAHSIIPVRGDLPPYGQTDGVVRYDSAHLDWVASELVVPRSGHSVQRNPIAIEEVRRILVEHADQVCDDDAVACPRRLEPRPPGDRFAAEPATVELDVPEGERETLPLAEPGADDSSGADDPAEDVR